MRIFLLLTLTLFLYSCQQNQPSADLIITNANIWTGQIDNPKATALAISADTIVAVGSDAEIGAFEGANTQVIDLQGRMMTPGFIDSHVHLMTGGRSLLGVDLRDAATPQEFSQRIGNFAKTLPADEWILEGNWDHTLWGGELPQKKWIDSLTGDNPVLVMRLDWHMALANSAALAYAGIDKNTPEVEGGTIERDANGNPTGLLKDNAMNLVLDKMPPMTSAQKDKYFKAATDYFLANGVTSVHDVDGMNKDFTSYDTALKFRANNDLQVRIYAAVPLNEWEKLSKMERPDDKWIKTGCLKGFVDGSLGSHTAAFHDHYTDKKDDKGFFINTQNDLYKWVAGADSTGLHVLVHAIGDSAIHSLLDIYERVIAENGERDRRFRIEHTQHLAPADIPRFAELGVIASMQPYHAIDDGRWAEEYIGAKRIQTTYAFKSLLDANAKVAFGSDWAVAPAAPLQGIYAAVTRRTLDGKNPDGWIPEQKISVEQALVGYTRYAAYAAFEENTKGQLAVGKLADFVVLSEDVFKVDPVKIREMKVLETWVGGKRVFQFNTN
ncbi:MAG: amidohydrolase [Saprospiraceae bacterium]